MTGHATPDEIDRESAVPRYVQLAAILRGQIERGELAVGRRIPSQLELEQQYDLARGTIKKAIAMLRDEGLIERSPGLGMFVRDRGKGDG